MCLNVSFYVTVLVRPPVLVLLAFISLDNHGSFCYTIMAVKLPTFVMSFLGKCHYITPPPYLYTFPMLRCLNIDVFVDE